MTDEALAYMERKLVRLIIGLSVIGLLVGIMVGIGATHYLTTLTTPQEETR